MAFKPGVRVLWKCHDIEVECVIGSSECRLDDGELYYPLYDGDICFAAKAENVFPINPSKTKERE